MVGVTTAYGVRVSVCEDGSAASTSPSDFVDVSGGVTVIVIDRLLSTAYLFAAPRCDGLMPMIIELPLSNTAFVRV